MIANMKKIDSQEIKDYKILYEMFGDMEYKDKADKLIKSVSTAIRNQIKDDIKFLMISNTLEDNNTRYSTVIKVEDIEKTVSKTVSLLNSLGEIEYILDYDEYLEIKIKDSYLLCMFDYTEGVI
ncbi:hypothetical protein WKH56_20200 [Priestia sp. SB1]|uniref:hypothetical protein n=1 Tax=Priestia sp. SB1 TaxID=3132359 RepID=UPI00316CA6EF